MKQTAIKLIRGVDGFFTLTIARPTVHNALSDAVIAEIRETLHVVRSDLPRGLFLRGEGKSFCAGADLEWMKRASSYSKEENIKDAMGLSSMLNELSELPCPTVALVQGAAIGGGVGIISCCDVAIGVEKAVFALAEVRLINSCVCAANPRSGQIGFDTRNHRSLRNAKNWRGLFPEVFCYWRTF